MRSINKPEIKVDEVFAACISTVKSANLKHNLSNCTNLVVAAEVDFENKFVINTIYQIAQNLNIFGPIGKDQMTIVYSYRMVTPCMPGYQYYVYIKNSAPKGRCPFCSIRTVDTLDHYLPKALYPIYAVTPINLIPSCTPCNKGKLVSFPTTSENQTLHPYYDNIENVSWLKARIIRTSPLVFEYFVDPPALWAQILKDRVVNHFEAFKLNALYSDHASEEFTEIREQLILHYNNGVEELKEHLSESYNSRVAAGINAWRPVLYNAMLNDDWFCGGGVLT